MKLTEKSNHIIINEITAGIHLHYVIKYALSLRDESGKNVKFQFNDWKFTITKDSTFESVLQDQEEQDRIIREKWVNSDEYKVMVEKAKKETREKLDNMKQALKNWPKFQDIKSVLDWCNTVTENYFSLTDKTTDKIMRNFAAAGMYPNMDTNPAYYAECKQNSGLYIVGQFLDGVRRKAVPEVFHHFYNEWNKKFNS